MKAFRALTELMRAHGSCAKGRLQSSARRHNVTPEARLAGEALDRYIASKRLDGFDGVWVVVLRELEGVPPVRTLDEARELYLSLSRRAMVLDREAFRIALGLETELGWWDFIDEEDDDAEHAPFQFGGGTREGYKELAAYVPEISFALHVHSPEWFVPFGFARLFDQFESICSELNVPLSPPPGEKSHQERAEYYWALNEELVQLRQRLKLNPEQFNAFLYGFAVGYTETPQPEDLPPPQRAWLLLGTPDGDHEFLEGANRDDVSTWQGSRGMRPGDIAVIWVRSPYSCTHSICRTLSAGTDDPFYFHYRRVMIGDFVKVPHVRFKDIRQNAVWQNKPEVHAHFQGASGREISAAEYEALLEMWAQRGFDVSTLPTIERPVGVATHDIDNERDVELRLLEPLLAEHGLEAAQWQRQYPLRMGRGERVYPDYIVGLTGTRGEESAHAIIEAKLTIGNHKQLHEAFLQARSYAERLRAEVIALVAVQGVWVIARGRQQLRLDSATHFTWDELADRRIGEQFVRTVREPSRRRR